MPDLDFLARLDGVAQAELVQRGELSALDLLDACAARIAAVNPLIHAVTHLDLDRARDRARAGVAGPFAGVPFLVKDVVAYPGMRWSMGSRLFAGNVAAEGSPFVDRVDRAGLVTVGKTMTSEYGLLGSTETLLEGVAHNPWDLSRSAAGSSGGAAAAVASGMVPIAHASDGGGSVRIPASVCGLFGLKPSRGRVPPTSPARSDYGDLVSDLCISRSVRDSALFLSAIEVQGQDALHPPVGYVRAPSRARLRIGVWSRTLIGGEADPEVRVALEDAASLCRDLGHRVEENAPPAVDGAALSDAFFTVAAAAISGLFEMMAPMIGRPVGPRDVEPFTFALVERHRRRPPGALDAARIAIAAAARTYLEAIAGFDAVLTPTLAAPPWKLGELSPVLDVDTLVRRTERAVGYTPIHNVAGCPGMSVPLFWSAEGLPIGVHFAAAPGAEALLLGLAYELEAARPWRDRWAPFSWPAIFAR